jgi:hypothetical protein
MTYCDSKSKCTGSTGATYWFFETDVEVGCDAMKERKKQYGTSLDA